MIVVSWQVSRQENNYKCIIYQHLSTITYNSFEINLLMAICLPKAKQQQQIEIEAFLHNLMTEQPLNTGLVGYIHTADFKSIWGYDILLQVLKHLLSAFLGNCGDVLLSVILLLGFFQCSVSFALHAVLNHHSLFALVAATSSLSSARIPSPF